MKRIRWVVIFCIGLASAQAGATGTVSNGNASLQMVGVPVQSLPLGDGALIVDTAAPDQLYKYTWYYRTQLGTNRLFGSLAAPVESYSGNTITLTWTENGDGPPGLNRFNAVLTLVLTDGAAPNQAVVRGTMQFQASPANAATQTFQLFCLTDVDLKGGGANPAADDSLIVTDAAAVRALQSEQSTFDYCELLGAGATRWEVNTGLALRTKLNGGGANLNDAVSAGGDVAAAFQWSVTLAPGATQHLKTVYTIDSPATLCAMPGDMNTNGSVRGDDIQEVVRCVLGGGASCECADVNTNGVADATDVQPFITRLLTP